MWMGETAMGTRTSGRTLQSRLLPSLSLRTAAVAACMAFAGVTGSAFAGPVPGYYVLTDGNSTTTFNTQSQFGQNSYTVDGKNVLSQDWFWYRIGATGNETSIDALTQTFAQTSAGDPSNPTEDNILSTKYAG